MTDSQPTRVELHTYFSGSKEIAAVFTLNAEGEAELQEPAPDLTVRYYVEGAVNHQTQDLVDPSSGVQFLQALLSRTPGSYAKWVDCSSREGQPCGPIPE